jgi:catechol 2,3-dioxygenase
VRLTSDGVSGGRAPRAATGLFHTARRYSDRGAQGRALGRVLQAGLLTGASDHGVSEAIYLDDPDGNGVELYWDRPREVWPPPAGPGDKVGMFTAPLDLESLLATGQADPVEDAVVDIGHVHLKVSDLDRSVAWWSGDLGLDVMARWLDQAAFLAAGGYHHHVGMNIWHSLGAAPGPRELPGLEEVRLSVGNDEPVVVEDPDGIRVVLGS